MQDLTTSVTQSAYNLSIMSFDDQAEYLIFCEANRPILDRTWLWHETLGDRADPFEISGICDFCERVVNFKVSPRKVEGDERFQYRVDWWMRMVCPCGMPTIDRAVMRLLKDDLKSGDPVYHVGHFSQFRARLSELFLNCVSSQFEEGRKPGEIENGVRFEDLTQTSFAKGQFAATICMEILEHIPDYKKALREMARITRPGGRVLLTFPWLGRAFYEHRTRAELLPDGTIKHILPPEYHGDPAKNEGILSFRDFGWKILDELREAGFSKASAVFIFGPLYGYTTQLHPVIVGIR